MKTIKTAVLLAMLASNCRASKTCGAGYEVQFMDEDSLGYCTRIPSLQEQADRAEAFLKHGLPRMHHLCIQINRSTGLQRDELVTSFQLLANKVELMRLSPYTGISASNVYAFNKIADSPDGKRITATLDVVQNEIVNCKNAK